MFRAIGVALLFFGVSGPTLVLLCLVLLCSPQCHSMQSASSEPAHIDFFLKEAPLPCCLNQQVMAGQSSMKPQTQFRTVGQLPEHTGNDFLTETTAPTDFLIPLHRLAFLSSNLSSPILRI